MRYVCVLVAAVLFVPVAGFAQEPPSGEDSGESEGQPESEAESELPAPVESPVPVDPPVDSREAEMFGADEDEPAEGDNAETDSADTDKRDEALFDGNDSEAAEESMFGESSDGDTTGALENRFDSIMQAIEDTTALGGQLYLRLDYTEGPARYTENPDGSIGEDEVFSSTNLFDLYLDSRPVDRVRGFIRGRLSFDPTVRDSSRNSFGGPVGRESVLLDQLWLKFDIFRVAYLTVGKQPIRWGSGRFWNPTDFVNDQTRDPLSVFDVRTGVTLVKAHFPVESLGWNFYAIANVGNMARPEEIGLAGRAEFLYEETELALSVGWRQDNPLKIGIDISSAVWVFDLRAELAITYDEQQPFFASTRRLELADVSVDDPESVAALVDVFGSGEFPIIREGGLYQVRRRSRADQVILQGTAGIETEVRYTEEGDTFFAGVEYFFNDYGYKTSGQYQALAANGQFNPLFFGRHYAAFFVSAFAPFKEAGLNLFEDSTFVLSTLANLSDFSFTTRFDYMLTALRYLRVNAYVMVHYGAARGALNYGVEPLPEETLSELERGIALAAGAGVPADQLPTSEQLVVFQRGQPSSEVEIGLALRVNF